MRAVAVLTVIFFHAGFEWMSGGFVGVDVFFVISGYLITSIIYSESLNKTFTYRRFYERRARRILPALFLVLLVTLPLGWMLMLPHQLKDHFQTLFAVNIFSSNFLFWIKSGYFDTASELKPLLHTWSLAVEEQFYLIFPVLVLSCIRFNRRALVWAVSLIALISFGLAEWRWGLDEDGAFYLIITRAWELAIGSLVALTPPPDEHRDGRPMIRELLALGSLLAIIATAVIYTERTPFPGLYALVPTVAAAILIRYGKDTHVALHFLATRPVVLIGLISYSAYLWHQPIFAFTRLARTDAPPVSDYWIGIVLTLVLALLSWKYLETPFRNRQRVSERNLWISVVVVSGIFMGVGLLGSVKNGFPDRLNEQASHFYGFKDSHDKNVKACWAKVEAFVETLGSEADLKALCTLGLPGKPVVGLLGDSHAATLTVGLSDALQRLSLPGVDLAYNACPPLDTGEADQERRSTEVCVSFRDWVFRDPPALPDTLILMARWPLMLEGERFDNGEGGHEPGPPFNWRDARTKRVYTSDELLAIYRQSITRLLNLGKRVILIYGTPEAGWVVPDRLARLAMHGEVTPETGSTSHARYLERHGEVIALFDSLGEHPGLYRIRPDKEFCNVALKGRCEVHAGGDSLYYDDDHLSLPGAERLVGLIEPVLAEIHGRDAGQVEVSK